MCAIHGGPAKLRWMPNGKTMGDDGKLVLNKKYFYVCDLGPRGSGKKMKQTKLSFPAVKTTNGEDNTILGLGESLEKSENTTATEGQQHRCVMNT